jgi:hypothetical protein
MRSPGAASSGRMVSRSCCQTRVAVVARKLGVIKADIAVALSLSLTHKAIGFDRRMPDVDFDSLELPATGTLPLGVPGAGREEARETDSSQDVLNGKAPSQAPRPNSCTPRALIVPLPTSRCRSC